MDAPLLTATIASIDDSEMNVPSTCPQAVPLLKSLQCLLLLSDELPRFPPDRLVINA